MNIKNFVSCFSAWLFSFIRKSLTSSAVRQKNGAEIFSNISAGSFLNSPKSTLTKLLK